MVMAEDLGVFMLGDSLPNEWLSVTELSPLSKRGSVTFGCCVEASFKGGWLRLHALEDVSAGFIKIEDAHLCDIHFCHDIRLFDQEGRMVGEIIYSPGVNTKLC